MATDLPAELHALVAELKDQGFTVVANTTDDAHFGNRLLGFENSSRGAANEIRLVKDRGLWSAEVEVGGKWRDPYQVLLALDGASYGRRASSHEERRSFTLEVLRRLPQSPSELQPIIDRLTDFDREYWRRFERS